MPSPVDASQLLLTTISRASAEHYTWGQNCHGWHLVKETALSVIEEVMPAHTAEQLHRHHVAQQFFYILSGEAVMEIAGKSIALPAGEGFSVAPGQAHRIRNSSSREVRFLVISQPSTKYGDRENLEG